MMDDEPRRRSSRDTRHALTVALLKPGRGALLEPGHELVQGHVVHTFRDGQGDAVEHECLQFLCAISSTAIKSCISGPFNGHYRPPEH